MAQDDLELPSSVMAEHDVDYSQWASDEAFYNNLREQLIAFNARTPWPGVGGETSDHAITDANDYQLAQIPPPNAADSEVPSQPMNGTLDDLERPLFPAESEIPTLPNIGTRNDAMRCLLPAVRCLIPAVRVLADTVGTVRAYPNFIDELGDTVNIFGQKGVLDMLEAATVNGARVQESVCQSKLIYEAIHRGLLQIYHNRGMPCPTLQDIAHIHSDPARRDMLRAVEADGCAPKQLPDEDAGLHRILAILRMLSMIDFQKTNKYVPYQLGILSYKNCFLRASVFPKFVSKDVETVWLYLKPGLSHDPEASTWHGICSDHAIKASKPATTTKFVTSNPAVLGPKKKGARVAKSTRTAHAGKTTNKKATSDGKRETAIQILLLRNEFPPHITPEQILGAQGDILHYNNLLRAAIWYSNKEIFRALNNTRAQENKASANALSAITKRIKVAIHYLADDQGVSREALRTVFNEKRGDNRIPTRDMDPTDDGAVQSGHSPQWKVDQTLEMIVSGSKHSGLVRWRDIPAPVVRTSMPKRQPGQVATPATTPELERSSQDDSAGEAPNQDLGDYEMQDGNFVGLDMQVIHHDEYKVATPATTPGIKETSQDDAAGLAPHQGFGDYEMQDVNFSGPNMQNFQQDEYKVATPATTPGSGQIRQDDFAGEAPRQGFEDYDMQYGDFVELDMHTFDQDEDTVVHPDDTYGDVDSVDFVAMSAAPPRGSSTPAPHGDFTPAALNHPNILDTPQSTDLDTTTPETTTAPHVDDVSPGFDPYANTSPAPWELEENVEMLEWPSFDDYDYLKEYVDDEI